MPRQPHKIAEFHGGLNSNADPRDIADNELSECSDIVVDELGKIRLMGAPVSSYTGVGVDIEPGYGFFHFAHDRVNGHLGEHLDEGDFATHANWDVNGDVSDTTVAGQLTFTFDSGTLEGYAEQVADDRLEAGIGGITYAFTYTVAVTTAPDAFALTIASGFAASSTTLPFTAGTHTVTFTSHANAATSTFKIQATDDQGGGTTTQGVFSIDNVSLYIYDAAETGDDYLVMADNESSDPALYMFSKNQNKWSESQVVTMGSTNSLAATFYAVDGALRACDANFANDSIWRGYIKREWFPGTGQSVDINQWYSASQNIVKPAASYFKDDAIVDPEDGTSDYILNADGSTDKYETRINILADFTNDHTVYRCKVKFRYEVTNRMGRTVKVTIKAGPWNEAVELWGAGAVSSTFYQGYKLKGTHTGEEDITFDIALTDTNLTGADWVAAGADDAQDWWKVTATAVGASNVVVSGSTAVYEGVDGGGIPRLDDHASSYFANGYCTGNNVCAVWAWNSAGGSGWQNQDGTKKWKTAVSFIYDEIQESLMTEMVDEADGSTIETESSSSNPGSRPALLIAIADPNHNSTTGDADGTAWNKRITGCNLYVQDVTDGDSGSWYQMATMNFITGKLKVTNTQIEYDARYFDSAHQKYFYWHIKVTELDSPPDIVTYEASSGIPASEKSIISKYKTAVVANRRTYIGNLQPTYDVGGVESEVRGDAMIKSPVNRFDVFPSTSIIEASVRDGDEIIKLEEYADRILQFKKNKMHLINISQQVEFLEDTFMYKGISHPAAVCKTDFGIAWVNKQGCYLYDGQKVNNLLEREGRRIIKGNSTGDADSWEEFTLLNPMIGYISKKRQLLIANDITTAGTGTAFLYDLIARTWTRGNQARITPEDKTNFITDWKGDLLYAHTTGTILKWSDASVGSANLVMKTKDIDFGHPGILKNIYKVYLSAKGNGAHVRVHYGTDGQPPDRTFFPITSDTDGSSAGGSGTAKCIAFNMGVTDWLRCELVPSTSSQARNISSFRLQVSGDTTNEIANTFEINDITIIYRLKGVR